MTAMEVRQAAETMEEALRGIFLQPNVRMIRIPNEYCGDNCCPHRPWFIAKTCIGDVKVGWRKRVIVLDWSASNVTKPAAELFADEDVTKQGRMIHCWGYDRARAYYCRLMEAFVADPKTIYAYQI